MEKKEKRVTVKKAGGNSGFRSLAYVLNIPIAWIKAMEINQDERDVTITLDEEKGQIRIKKVKNESTSSEIQPIG